MQGLRKLPTGVQLWLMILGMSNMMAPLFFIAQREAYVMFIATMLSFAVGVVLYKIQGMTRLMGERDEHLASTLPGRKDIILHDRHAAGKAVLIA